MKEPPEAGSLSALNLLAANPPRYPVNPTEEPREPLTLYISRVPGTRDIILSTLKPQRKNVTSEDVANALYYVHLDLPSDGLLAPTAAAAAGANVGANVGATAAPTVVRKPLPSQRPAPPAHTDTSILPNPPPPVLTGPPSSATFPLTSPSSVHTSAPPAYSTVSAAVTDQPPAPPPHREPVSPRPPQPWVPPGFRLDEHHSFDVTSGAGATPATTATPATGPAVVTGVDTLPSQRPQQPQQGQPFPATSLPIRSRPLPGRTLPANNHNNGGPSQSQPQAGPSQPGPSASHQSPAGIPRKPVGPRPDGDAAFRPQDKALPHPPQQVPQQAPQVQAPPRAPPPAVTPSQSTPSNFVPFQLTLIRRDAANNHQWNIGKIASVQQVQDDDGSGSDGDAPPVSEQPSIRIHLETSGYAKFRGDDGGQSFARRVEMAYTKSWTAGIRNAFKRHERSSSEGGPVDAPGASQYGQYQHPQDPDLEPPRRFLRTRGNSLASTADSALGGLGPEMAPALPPRRSREKSRSTSPPLITRPGPGLKPKGYTFTSPWDGRCDFRTGNGGRSLKCRHILHPSTDATTGATGGGVAGYNPLVIAQSFRDGTDKGFAAVAAATSSVVGGVTGAGGGGGGGGGADRGRARSGSLTSALTGAVGVSELRFNLPHGDLIRKRDRDNSEDGERGSRDQLYGRFQDHLHHLQHRRRGSSTEEDDEDYPDEDEELDLSLGREKAGGGNRGKRAKLGKLIIYDDGFKMLDLVVAANMGIWWVSWERIF